MNLGRMRIQGDTAMFLEFYGLKEQPFGVTPDPRFICPSKTHCKAYNSLSRGLEAGCGLLALIAKPGMGKTTLVFQLLKQLSQTSRPIFLFHTQCNSHGFLCHILRCLGTETAGLDAVGMLERLKQVIVRERLAGRQLVLIIDECQNLDSSVLETVRLLSDFETPETKLIQIVLVGQTQLAANLSSPCLASLRQRISILCRLEPLTREEIVRYIEHRLRIAGYRGAPLFTDGALEWILVRSEGIPRNINNLCLNALLGGYQAGRRQIDFDVVDKVLDDLDENPPKWNSESRTPIIHDSGMFRANRDSTQVSSQDIEEIVIEFAETPPDPVPQLGHTQAPQKAQSDPYTAKGNISEQKQPASNIAGHNAAHSDTSSLSQKTSQSVRLQTPALQRTAVISHPEISSARWRSKTVGALTVGAALTALLLFSFRGGLRREFQVSGGAVGAPVGAPPPSPPVSSALAAGSTLVTSPLATNVSPTRPFVTRTREGKIVRIVIDPGHGGRDTGTTGPAGLKEKDLCMDIALRLGRIIKQRLPSVEVIFTRTNDTFIPLEERTYIANDIKADLFLSIHANSSPYPAARGIETYYLDLAGSTEVMELAARENATAQGPDRLERMKKTGLGEKIEESRMLAEDLQESLNRFVQHSGSGLESRRVRRAPFVVLAGANMPSVLAEIAFPSNPSDEQLLRKGEYCERLAEGLYQGLANYLQGPNGVMHSPPTTTNPVVVPSAAS